MAGRQFCWPFVACLNGREWCQHGLYGYSGSRFRINMRHCYIHSFPHKDDFDWLSRRRREAYVTASGCLSLDLEMYLYLYLKSLDPLAWNFTTPRAVFSFLTWHLSLHTHFPYFVQTHSPFLPIVCLSGLRIFIRLYIYQLNW